MFAGVGDPNALPQAVLYQQVMRQAAMLGFLDVFRALMILILVLTPTRVPAAVGQDAAAAAEWDIDMLKKPILLVSMLAITACTVGPNYTKPDLAVPAASPAARRGAAGPGDRPGALVGSVRRPELTGLIDRALKDNPDMAAAASRVRQARLGEIQARAQYKPTVDADANATDVKFSKNAGFSSLARAFSGGGGGRAAAPRAASRCPATASRPSRSGSTRAGSSTSSAAGGAGSKRRWRGPRRPNGTGRDAAVMLAAEVADAYFALRLDLDQIAVLDSEIERQGRALQIAGNIAKVGLVPGIDVTRQNGNITATRARIEPLKADLEVRKHALGVLLGQNPESLLGELSGPLPALAATPTIPGGLAERPAAPPPGHSRRGAQSGGVDRRYRRRGRRPLSQVQPDRHRAADLDLARDAVHRRQPATDRHAARRRFPLLDWGKRKATVGVRKEQREQAYQAYRTAVLQGLRDVEDALTRIDAERRRNALLRAGAGRCRPHGRRRSGALSVGTGRAGHGDQHAGRRAARARKPGGERCATAPAERRAVQGDRRRLVGNGAALIRICGLRATWLTRA